TPTICAERVAVSKCISEGHRDIYKIAVVGSENKTSFPCGVCRQFMSEFGKDIKVICARNLDYYDVYTLEELLPNSFGPDDLD
ncbi:MAG: cytidine deaminase, partial [Tissierellia bacterium]|nr:cytidine deaminase [Tissierellia bacterium]